MKILITGCTSQQSSRKHAERTPTFSNLLAQSFKNIGADVAIASPSISWEDSYLQEFDLVIVGISPTTSISANKVYPAFIVAEKCRKIGNLALLVDAPESFKIPPSLKAWTNESATFKSFYDRRKSYFEVLENENLRENIKSFVSYLSNEEWPTTFYPTFPWSTSDLLIKYLPNLSAEKAIGVSVDSYILLQPQRSKNYLLTEEYWTCDLLNSASKNCAKTLTKEVVAAKQNVWELESETLLRIRESIGTIITTYRNNESWWSPVLSQALSQGVPVSHDWKITSYMGSEWMHLPTSIELMTSTERNDLAYAQKQSYLNQLPSQDDINEVLNKTLKQLV